MGKRLLFGVAVFVLVIAFGMLYLRGLDFGRPFQLHPDERYIVEVARNIAASGDYNPHFLEYPSLPIYMQLGVSCLTHVRMVGNGSFRSGNGDPQNRKIGELTPRDAFEHYYAGRAWMAVLAGATLIMVYMLAAELLGRAAALFATAATLVSSLFLEQAHYVTPNLYMTLFALATLYACFRYLKTGNIRTIYLAAVMAGLGIGSKYPVFVVLLPVFATVVWKLRLPAWKHVIGLFLTASAVFVITTPYSLLDLPQFLESLGVVSLQYLVTGVNETSAAPLPPVARYFLTIWRAAPVLTLCGLLGFVALPFVRNYRRSVLFVLFAIPYGAMVLDSKVVYPRNLVPLLPIRAIAAAAVMLFVWRIASGGKVPGTATLRRPRFAYLCCAILVAACLWRPVTRCVMVTNEFEKQSAFQAADAWFQTKVPNTATVTADHFSTAPAVPCAGGLQKVNVIDGAHFSAPYVYHISTDYVVSTAGDAYDGAVWRKMDYIDKLARKTSPRDIKYVESYLTQNRRLAETRLPSARVFDSAPPGPTEVLLAGGVMIAKVPKFEVIECKGLPAPTDDLAKDIASKHIETAINLKPGEYDLFLEAQQLKTPNGKFAASAPAVTVALAGVARSIECRFAEQKAYYVSSFSAASGGAIKMSVDFPGNCPVTRIGLVRAGEALAELNSPASPGPIFFGENLIANSDFDRGPLRWIVESKNSDFVTSISEDTAHGIRSLAVVLKGSCNLGIRQDIASVTPGAEYLLTAHIACRDLVGGARVEVQDGQGGWKSFAKWTNSVTGTTTWQKVALRFKLPDNVTTLAVILRRPTDPAGDEKEGALWFDDIRLHQLHNP